MLKFNLSGTEAASIYSFFYGAIYILALVGGLIANKIHNYKETIITGIIVMSLGAVFDRPPVKNCMIGRYQMRSM